MKNLHIHNYWLVCILVKGCNGSIYFEYAISEAVIALSLHANLIFWLNWNRINLEDMYFQHDCPTPDQSRSVLIAALDTDSLNFLILLPLTQGFLACKGSSPKSL